MSDRPTTETAYRDPRCRIAPLFPDHVCSRRDDRPLREAGEDCFWGNQRPSLLDEAYAERVVDAVVDAFLQRDIDPEQRFEVLR